MYTHCRRLVSVTVLQRVQKTTRIYHLKPIIMKQFIFSSRHIIAVCLCLLFSTLYGQDTTEQRARQKYQQLKTKEISIDRFVEIHKLENARQSLLIKNPKSVYTLAGLSGNTPCGNGDFESGLITAEWSGAYGTLGIATTNGGTLNSLSLTAGLTPVTGGSANLNQPGARHTLVTSPDNDATTGMPVTAPLVINASTKAIRIGNSVNGANVEMVSKTFTVTAAESLIRFWYAVVLQSPNHTQQENPYFHVRVVDNSTNTELGNVVNMGTNGKVIADRNNPFFKSKTVNGEIVNYKEWSCAEINLAAHVGKRVTIQFITADCTLGGHYGYAYIDNICGSCQGSPEGSIALNRGKSDTCGTGKISVDYTLPKNGTQTGALSIKLDIIQNGTVITSINSGAITGNITGTYSFGISPLLLSSLNSNLGGFDYVATGTFSLNNVVYATKTSGTFPVGLVAGANNDYKIACGGGVTGGTTACGCPNVTNLVKNGDFESGSGGFSSQFKSFTGGILLPGTFAVASSTNYKSFCANWNIADPGTNMCNKNSTRSNGQFLVVNGQTGQAPVAAWTQTISLSAGKTYKFCARLRNLPQCCFDVKPQVSLSYFDGTQNRTTAPVTVNQVQGNACDWLNYSVDITIPQNAPATFNAQISIMLNQSQPGDGNDLAIDDLSLIQLNPMPATQIDFGENISGINSAGQYTITAITTPLAPGDTFGWEVQEIDNTGNTLSSLVNQPAWLSNPLSCNFSGYTFVANKRYRIIRTTSGNCNSLGAVAHTYSKEITANRIVAKRDETYRIVLQNQNK